MDHQNSISALRDLGLTEIESMVYTFLLSKSPATGYRVAQAIGKPVANTYKAIEALELRGLLIVEEGEKRLCRTVPYEEMLALLERRFMTSKQRAARALAAIQPADDDERVYNLRSSEQVFERCRAMIERAEQLIIVDAFPLPLEELRPDLEKAAELNPRLEIRIKAYRPVAITGARVVAAARGAAVLEKWPGQWLNAVIDANEHLLSFLTRDGTQVHQAVWSNSPYLSYLYYSGVQSEITCDRVKALLSADADVKEIHQEMDAPWAGEQLLGYQRLIDRFEPRRKQSTDITADRRRSD